MLTKQAENTGCDPLISVIVPAYNAEKTLVQCVDSIIGQTYENLEIWLIDDGSTDTTGEICDRYAKDDKRIKVIHQANQGVASARSNALNQATGDYIAFVDSDDFLGKEHLNNLLNAITEGKTRVAVTGSTPLLSRDATIEPNNTIAHPDLSILDGEEAACIAVRSVTYPFAEHPWGKLYDSSLAPYLHFPKDRNWEDQFVMYKVFMESGTVAYEEANDYYYVQSTNSRSRQRDDHFFDTLDARKEIIEYARAHRLAKLEETTTQKYHSRVVGIYADLNLLAPGKLSEKAYGIVRAERKEGIASPFTARTTKLAYLLSYLPKKIFSQIMLAFEKRRIAKANAEQEHHDN